MHSLGGYKLGLLPYVLTWSTSGLVGLRTPEGHLVVSLCFVALNPSGSGVDYARNTNMTLKGT